MKTPLYGLAIAGLLAGYAVAGGGTRGEAMRSDTDGDGRISRAEAEAASSKRSAEWFDKLDLDKDGYVTREEMKQVRETRRGEMKARFEERFKEADANSDGQLSLDEVQANMPRLAERFNKIDQDKNGLLSRDELQRQGRGHHRKPAETQS